MTSALLSTRIGKEKLGVHSTGSCAIARIAAPLLLVIFSWDLCVSETKNSVSERTMPPAVQRIDIPFTLYDGYVIVVDGQIGGLEHQKLLLDTGTNPSVIGKDVSSKLGLTGRERGLALFNKSLTAQSVTLDSLQIGPLRAKSLQVMVADLSQVARQLGTRLDGVVGMDVLGTHSFTIDYRNKRIHFEASQQPNTASFSSGVQFITLDVKVGGKRLHMIVDTGTPQLVLFRMDGLDSMWTPTVHTGRNLSGSVFTRMIILPEATIGTDTLGPQHASVVSIQNNVPKEVDGLIGLFFLHPTSVSFDFERQVLGWSR